MGWCSGKKTRLSAGAMVAIILPAYLGIVNASDHKGDPEVASAETGMSDEVLQEKKMSSKDVLGYEFEMLDGTTRSLEDFRGSVVLFVNVASACGLTPQYEGLEAMYQKYKVDGLVIVGFPANEFGAQEPGTNAEIALFCSGEYGVTFPMTGKIVVKGNGVHPLYAQLASQPEPIGGEPEWNFTKFVVNRSGEVVGRFSSRTTPEDPKLISTIEGLLGEE